MTTPTNDELKSGLDTLMRETQTRAIQFTGTIDPSAVGFQAPVGSMYIQKTGGGALEKRWEKTGTAANAWAQLAGGGGGGARAVVNVSTFPHNAAVNKDLLIDVSASGGNIVLPAAPAVNDIIGIIPVNGSFATNPIFLIHNGKAIGGIMDDAEVNTDGLSFDLRYVGGTLGWIALGPRAASYVQNATVNASDIIEIRQAAGTAVALTYLDREKLVVTTSATNGTVTLPLASTVQPGWQCTVEQGGAGEFQFLPAAGSGDILQSLGGQDRTLGQGALVTVVLTGTNTWLIAGALTSAVV